MFRPLAYIGIAMLFFIIAFEIPEIGIEFLDIMKWSDIGVETLRWICIALGLSFLIGAVD